MYNIQKGTHIPAGTDYKGTQSGKKALIIIIQMGKYVCFLALSVLFSSLLSLSLCCFLVCPVFYLPVAAPPFHR